MTPMLFVELVLCGDGPKETLVSHSAELRRQLVHHAPNLRVDGEVGELLHIAAGVLA